MRVPRSDVTHYIGASEYQPKDGKSIKQEDRELNTTYYFNAVAACGIPGWNAPAGKLLLHKDKQCPQCIEIMETVKEGAAVATAVRYMIPTSARLRDDLEQYLETNEVSVLLKAGMGDFAYTCLMKGCDSSVVYKRIMNDMKRHKTPWDIALKLMIEETDGVEYGTIRHMYEWKK